ncbi:MAG TPA: DUF423 domain-containing protein [Planctomycetota bacterium]|nr:DUF423 domain-containing protein [Planctomycetota bacterium]
MRAARCWTIGAALGAAAVVLGAFAAHAMKGRYDAERVLVFETGARYQMYHALALCLCGALGRTGRAAAFAARAFVVGVLLFCGSLYLLALTDTKWLGAVTPFGGVALVSGWIALAMAARPQQPTPD